MAQEQELLKRFFVAVSAAVLLMTKLMADNVDELGEFELVLNCLIVIAMLEFERAIATVADHGFFEDWVRQGT